MKTFRISSDIYLAFARCTRGNLQVITLTDALTVDPVLPGHMVGKNLFLFIADWGMDKRKAVQIKAAVESPAGVQFFKDKGLRQGSMFFRRMTVAPESHEPLPVERTSKGRAGLRIISVMRHPSSSAITLTGNTQKESDFATCISRQLKKWNQPEPTGFTAVPLTKQELTAGYCKIRVFFPHRPDRTYTKPIVEALLKELS